MSKRLRNNECITHVHFYDKKFKFQCKTVNNDNKNKVIWASGGEINQCISSFKLNVDFDYVVCIKCNRSLARKQRIQGRKQRVKPSGRKANTNTETTVSHGFTVDIPPSVNAESSSEPVLVVRRKRKQSKGGGGSSPKQKFRAVQTEAPSQTGNEESPPNPDIDEPQVDHIIKVEPESESDPVEDNIQEESFDDFTNQDLASDPDIEIGEVEVKVFQYPEDQFILEDEGVGEVDSNKIDEPETPNTDITGKMGMVITEPDSSKEETFTNETSEVQQGYALKEKGYLKMSVFNFDNNVDPNPITLPPLIHDLRPPYLILRRLDPGQICALSEDTSKPQNEK